ncbi:hypothetical protein EV186_10688 [Labedaea rhizosphaerae]|uniref:Uncharacterized protein n=2 Tax=Labedaea rhizosphaerae TaxID=598644 RepID=A0A4R6S3A6_LABRH|nr:hypothetical protein EV186_10688 [Labedaea rhizosphaerae]
MLFLAAACAQPVSAPGPAGPVEPYVTSADLCAKLPPEVPELPAEQSAVPADVTVSWVLECVMGPPAQSGATHVRVERADGPPAELLAALRLPSATEQTGPCTTEYLLPFYLALVTADRQAIAPFIPVDGCAKPRREVLAALGNLPFRPIK